MRKVTEKPDFTNARTVKVWTKAGTGRFFESGKSYFYTISWETTDFEGNIEIYYSTDGGETYPILITTVSAETGSYDWIIPEDDCTKCRIKIRGVNEDNAYLYMPYHESENFTIDTNDGENDNPSIIEIILRWFIDFLKRVFPK